MNTLTHQLRPLAGLLGHDSMPKKDFIKKVHLFYANSNRGLLNLLEMLPFSSAHREGDNVILD
jgi:hypothetical protein